MLFGNHLFELKLYYRDIGNAIFLLQNIIFPLLTLALTKSNSFGIHVCATFYSIIWPLRYSSDYRPFFTIHDSEFKEYTTKTQAP